MVYLQSPKQPRFFSLLICFWVDVYEFWCDSGQKKILGQAQQHSVKKKVDRCWNLIETTFKFSSMSTMKPQGLRIGELFQFPWSNEKNILLVVQKSG